MLWFVSPAEIAYIGSIHPMHYELTLLMLNHGKHVLCEKPLAMSERQARAMVELAKEKGLFLLEVKAHDTSLGCFRGESRA